MPETTDWKMPELSTNLYVRDVEKSAEFYTNVMGFKLGQTQRDEEGKLVLAEIRRGSGAFAIVDVRTVPSDAAYLKEHRKGPLGRGVVLGVTATNLDATYASFKGKKGLRVLCKPEDTGMGMRVMDVRDLNGFTWSFIEQR
ncbi:MAG TPA: VOC family protein [Thermoplasmata archaeon]|nr:VOC family protein [Thermoplasmata archaeon]